MSSLRSVLPDSVSCTVQALSVRASACMGRTAPEIFCQAWLGRCVSCSKGNAPAARTQGADRPRNWSCTCPWKSMNNAARRRRVALGKVYNCIDGEHLKRSCPMKFCGSGFSIQSSCRWPADQVCSGCSVLFEWLSRPGFSYTACRGPDCPCLQHHPRTIPMCWGRRGGWLPSNLRRAGATNTLILSRKNAAVFVRSRTF